jgi:alkaline phosphatase D
MIWDDHEIGDGWGSYMKTDLADLIKKRGWSVNERVALCERMFDVAKQVYHEYQHSHNPVTPPGQYDYTYSVGSSAFYVLDGRGYRDLRRRSYRILGKEQMERFVGWLEQLNDTTRFVFVVSAVPLLQLSAIAGRVASLKRSLLDDLRDSWEHPTHDDERKVLMDALFAAARRGIRVCVLSGDVHTAAVFRLQDRTRKHTIYQLTSSAITYNVGRVAGWLLALAAKGNGNTRDGYRFERLALYRRSNFAMVRVDPAKDRAEFRLYGQDLVSVGEDRDRRVPVQTRSRTEISDERLDEIPGGHSIATIPLEFT